MFVSWLVVGIAASLLIPAIFADPQWNHQAIGSIVSPISLIVVAIPLGIYGFIRHRRRRGPA